MNGTTRFAVIGLLCAGTSALSFGETFQSINSTDWNATYNANTALFSAVVQQNQASVESGMTGPVKTGAFNFGNGTEQDFTLTYDPSNGDASLTIGSTVLDFTALTVSAAGGGLDHIGIALSAGTDEAVAISSIVLNNDDSGSVALNAGPALFDFAMTPPTDLTGGPVTLSGKLTMNWSGAANGSEISAEIVGADSLTAAPEPGTWALLGSALAGLGLLRRKRIV